MEHHASVIRNDPFNNQADPLIWLRNVARYIFHHENFIYVSSWIYQYPKVLVVVKCLWCIVEAEDSLLDHDYFVQWLEHKNSKM